MILTRQTAMVGAFLMTVMAVAPLASADLSASADAYASCHKHVEDGRTVYYHLASFEAHASADMLDVGYHIEAEGDSTLLVPGSEEGQWPLGPSEVYVYNDNFASPKVALAQEYHSATAKALAVAPNHAPASMNDFDTTTDKEDNERCTADPNVDLDANCFLDSDVDPTVSEKLLLGELLLSDEQLRLREIVDCLLR